jgi:hypothetical protein
VEDGKATRLSGVEVLRRLTLRIRLSRPDATFLQKLAFPTSFVVEPSHAAQHGLNLRDAAGTGPWSMQGRGRDGSLILAPRKHYYAGPLQLRSLVLVPVHDEGRALELYKKGSIDAAYIPAEDFKNWTVRSDFHTAGGLTAYYALPSRNTRVAWATLDRTRLVQRFSGALTPLSSIVPPAVPDYVPPSGSTTGQAASGAVTVRSSGGRDPMLRQLAAALAAQMKSRATDPPGDAVVTRRTYLLPVPGVWLSMILSRTSSSWFRRNLDETSNLTNDPVSRMNIYGKIEQWALNRHLVVPLASASVGYAIKPSVSGLQVTAFGLMPDNGNWNTVQVG